MEPWKHHYPDHSHQINILLLVGGLVISSHLLFYTFFIGLAVELLIIIIKGFENLVIMDSKPFTYEEKTGIAVTDIYPGRDGVVKIKNELWSARSNEKIKKNDKIIVKRIQCYGGNEALEI